MMEQPRKKIDMNDTQNKKYLIPGYLLIFQKDETLLDDDLVLVVYDL